LRRRGWLEGGPGRGDRARRRALLWKWTISFRYRRRTSLRTASAPRGGRAIKAAAPFRTRTACRCASALPGSPVNASAHAAIAPAARTHVGGRAHAQNGTGKLCCLHAHFSFPISGHVEFFRFFSAFPVFFRRVENSVGISGGISAEFLVFDRKFRRVRTTDFRGASHYFSRDRKISQRPMCASGSALGVCSLFV